MDLHQQTNKTKMILQKHAAIQEAMWKKKMAVNTAGQQHPSPSFKVTLPCASVHTTSNARQADGYARC